MNLKSAAIAILIALTMPWILQAAPRADRQFLEDGDRLRIRVFNCRGELEYDLREVVRRGEVLLPLLGPIPVLNLGLRRFQKRICGDFARRFLRDPYVHVHLERSARVLVKGPFLPQMIEVLQGASLFEALGEVKYGQTCRTLRLHRGRFVQEFAMDSLVKGYEKRGLLVGMRDGDVLELIP